MERRRPQPSPAFDRNEPRAAREALTTLVPAAVLLLDILQPQSFPLFQALAGRLNALEEEKVVFELPVVVGIESA